jgi:hypothetical protein
VSSEGRLRWQVGSGGLILFACDEGARTGTRGQRMGSLELLAPNFRGEIFSSATEQRAEVFAARFHREGRKAPKHVPR